jgi:NADPH:quinone reductase-like Zn-dependent oxidoreductase
MLTDRFALGSGHPSMKAVVTTGNGGYDKLVYRDVPMPVAAAGELVLQVLAAGVNNTEINTRVGWYADAVTLDTASAARSQDLTPERQTSDSGWNAPTPFPLIQGTDCCGRIVGVGAGVDAGRIGQRVLVRACMRSHGSESMDSRWMGSDFDGAFAQYVKVPAGEAFAVNCDWSDVELGSIPCAYGTAENLLSRAGVGKGWHVLVAGASGGVGSAAVQLAKRRGAFVTAIAGRGKMEAVRAIGADRVLERNEDLVSALGAESVDVVVDIVAGPDLGGRLRLLRRGGICVCSGAIGGPMVTIDMRHVYLKDLRLIGCTAWDEPVFPNLIGYIERGEIRPLVAKVFPLERIADAQHEFMEKKHVGNFVLVPPSPEASR